VVEIKWIDSGCISAANVDEYLSDVSGILVPGGFGDRGIEGMIIAAQYAREHKIPYFGLCLGMQIAVIEFARHVAGMTWAQSSEFMVNGPYPVIDLMPDQAGVSLKGGTMRLGKYPCMLKEDSEARRCYGVSEISERHRHRYEFNNAFRDELTSKGLSIAGTSPNGKLVEIVELKDHPWFVGVQFHPELKSRPNKPHPLFKGFVRAAVELGVRNG
jgi:CTP synthase